MADKFRTELKLDEAKYPEFSHNAPVSLIGSCFSTNIAEKLKEYRFQHISNPFGVTYNPISIADQIQRLINKDLFVKNDLFQRNDRWNSFELHGSHLNHNAKELLTTVNHDLKNCSLLLKKSSHFFMTFGTAWVYELKESGRIVNNCHKIPSEKFSKRILSVNEIVSVYQDLIGKLTAWNPKLIPVFTISPVRHLKDGFEENSLSKSLLRLAVNELVQTTNAIYFPSFEITMDDLRDYRFYKDDLVHPNDTAINYIWGKLCDAFLNSESKKFLLEIEAVNNALNHKAFDANSADHQAFILRTIDKLKVLEKSIPNISYKEEIKQLLDRIT